jgi:spoIIIJ-associated protein
VPVDNAPLAQAADESADLAPLAMEVPVLLQVQHPVVDGGSAPRPPDVDADADEPFEEDGRADTALDFTIDVLTAMGMDCTVDLLENDEEDPPEDIRLEIEGKDAGRVIGKKGQTLTALQFLANRVVNRPGRQRRHVIVDAEGYRARREDTLATMAKRLGKQAVDEGKIITFEPMNPQDRRVVHLALAKFPGVVTKSEGEGEARRVQIIPVRR